MQRRESVRGPAEAELETGPLWEDRANAVSSRAGPRQSGAAALGNKWLVQNIKHISYRLTTSRFTVKETKPHNHTKACAQIFSHSQDSILKKRAQRGVVANGFSFQHSQEAETVSSKTSRET